MAGISRVVVHEPIIDLWHQPGGMIYNALRTWTYETEGIAKGLVHSRSGDLARSIRVNFKSHKRSSSGVVEARAPYSLYVHEGTGGRTRKWGTFWGEGVLWLHDPPGFEHYRTRVNMRTGETTVTQIGPTPWVHGQNANPFLASAIGVMMRTNPQIDSFRFNMFRKGL